MCDISKPALEKALAKVKEIVPNAAGKVDPWGGLDVMFNNAGIMHADDAGVSYS
jgi:NAD(P)-dependent dehydrogenase (short-subunit alcohol dehydrogenase family)